MSSADRDKRGSQGEIKSSRKRKLQSSGRPNAIATTQLDQLMMKLLNGMMIFRHERSGECCDDETEQVISIKLECPKAPAGEKQERRLAFLSISVSHYRRDLRDFYEREQEAIEGTLTRIERSFRDFSASETVKGLKAQMIHLNLQWRGLDAGGTTAVSNCNLVPCLAKVNSYRGSRTTSVGTSTGEEKDYAGCEGSTSCITALVKIDGFGSQEQECSSKQTEESSSSFSYLRFAKDVHDSVKTFGDRMNAAMNVCGRGAIIPCSCKYSARSSPEMSQSDRSFEITNTIRIAKGESSGVKGLPCGSRPTRPEAAREEEEEEEEVVTCTKTKTFHVLGYFDRSNGNGSSFRSIVSENGEAASCAITSVVTSNKDILHSYSMDVVALFEDEHVRGYGGVDLDLLARASVFSSPECTCYLLHNFTPICGLHPSDKWSDLAGTLKTFGDELSKVLEEADSNDGEEEEGGGGRGGGEGASGSTQDPTKMGRTSSRRLHLVLHSYQPACMCPPSLQPILDIHLISLLAKKATEHLVSEMKSEGEEKQQQQQQSKQHLENIIRCMQNIALRSFNINLLTAISEIPTNLSQEQSGSGG